jgi:preprotein translocase subunit SecE
MSTPSESAQLANRSGMTPTRLVVIFLLVAGFVLLLFFDKIFGDLWASLGWPNPEVIEGPGWHVSTVVSIVLAAAIAIGSWVYEKSRNLLAESANELMKVTWPSWSETRTSTVMVIVASIITAAFLFAVDTFSYKLMVDWLPTLWGKL